MMSRSAATSAGEAEESSKVGKVVLL